MKNVIYMLFLCDIIHNIPVCYINADLKKNHVHIYKWIYT
jgi:hypothetical protein